MTNIHVINKRSVARKLKRGGILGAVAALCVFHTWAIPRAYDKSILNSNKTEIKNLVDKGDYESALKKFEEINQLKHLDPSIIDKERVALFEDIKQRQIKEGKEAKIAELENLVKGYEYYNALQVLFKLKQENIFSRGEIQLLEREVYNIDPINLIANVKTLTGNPFDAIVLCKIARAELKKLGLNEEDKKYELIDRIILEYHFDYIKFSYIKNDVDKTLEGMDMLIDYCKNRNMQNLLSDNGKTKWSFGIDPAFIESLLYTTPQANSPDPASSILSNNALSIINFNIDMVLNYDGKASAVVENHWSTLNSKLKDLTELILIVANKESLNQESKDKLADIVSVISNFIKNNNPKEIRYIDKFGTDPNDLREYVKDRVFAINSTLDLLVVKEAAPSKPSSSLNLTNFEAFLSKLASLKEIFRIEGKEIEQIIFDACKYVIDKELIHKEKYTHADTELWDKLIEISDKCNAPLLESIFDLYLSDLHKVNKDLSKKSLDSILLCTETSQLPKEKKGEMKLKIADCYLDLIGDMEKKEAYLLIQTVRGLYSDAGLTKDNEKYDYLEELTKKLMEK